MSADYWERKALNKCGNPDSFYPPGYKEEAMASVSCPCCHEPVFDLNLLMKLPCGVKVCEVCYYEDFAAGEECPWEYPGTDPDCVGCIFALCEAGPGYLTYSDALPGF